MHHPLPSAFRQAVDAATGTEAPAATASRNCIRQDDTRASAVEVAISLQDLLGTAHAASFLKDHFIDIDTTLRVLLQPAQRRRY